MNKLVKILVSVHKKTVLRAKIGWTTKKRLRDFGYDGVTSLSNAQIFLTDAHGNAACSKMAESTKRFLSKYLSPELAYSDSIAKYFHGTATLLDFRDITTIDDYLRMLKLRQKRNFYSFKKRVKHCSSTGFISGFFRHQDFVNQIFEIIESKPVRTSGVVLQYFLPYKRRDSPINAPFCPTASSCDQHWVKHFGAFKKTGGGDYVLCAFTKIVRTGNLLSFQQFYGHRDYLKDGVVDFVLHEVVYWLTKNRSTLAAGLDFLYYGALEHGGSGLARWKRHRAFDPYLISLKEQRSRPRSDQ